MDHRLPRIAFALAAVTVAVTFTYCVSCAPRESVVTIQVTIATPQLIRSPYEFIEPPSR
jgi:hypothetical protein